MFVIRLAVLIAIIAFFMPRDPESSARFMAQIDEVSAWAETSCDRNADTCQIASAVWNRVSTNAQYTAALIVDSARTKLNNDEIDRSSSIHIVGKAETADNARRDEGNARGNDAAGTNDDIGTLIGSDLGPAWRGTQD